MASFIERDERCIFVGNIDAHVTEEILWELFLQAGPLEAVHIPKDKETGRQKAYGFVSFSDEVSVPYAISLMDGIPLYGKAIKVNHASQNSNSNSPGNQSPSSYGYNFPDDAQLRGPLFDGQFSPQPMSGTPPPFLRNGLHGNFHRAHPSPMGPWDTSSPWQQGQNFQGRISPGSGHSPSPQFPPLVMNNRQTRYLDLARRRR